MDSETLLLTAIILGGGYFLFTQLEQQRQQTASWEQNLGKELGGLFTNFKDELAPIISTISSDLSSVEDKITTGFTNFETSAKQEFDSISTTLAGLGDSAKQEFNTVENFLTSSVSNKVQQTENIFENFGNEISKGWNSFTHLFS